MALAPGVRIGMGEAYKARDTRLDRTVAIKVLPASLAGDPDRIARFQQQGGTMVPLTRRAFLGLCALFCSTRPQRVVGREDEFIIVDGWILNRADLGHSIR